MVLSILNREIETYKKIIGSSNYPELYKWEALKNFQDNWNIDAVNFRQMFDSSFYSRENANLWSGQHWFPKAVMLRFIEHDPERVRQMFRDLLYEEQPVGKRIERFEYHCDKMLEEVSALDSKVKNHFHNGQRIITLYLAFRFPATYAIYKFTEFKTFMEVVQSPNIPSTGESERFFNIVRILYKRLQEDEVLTKLHKSLLTSEHYQGETLMLAQDFIFVIARRYMK